MDLGGHLRGLFRFAGRERRTTFWLWVLISYLVQMVLTSIAMVPLMMGAFDSMQRFAAEHPDFGQPGSAPPPPSFIFEMFPMRLMLAAGIFGFAIAVLLLAAAVTRRLHDSGRRGGWGLLPLPFLFSAPPLMGAVLAGMGEVTPSSPAMMPPAFGLVLLNNCVYLVALGTLIVFCCLPTQEYPNRYGPPPGLRVG